YPSGVEASASFTFEKEAAAGVAVGEAGPVGFVSAGAFFDVGTASAPAASVAAPAGIIVYPNPAQAQSTVGFALDAEATVRLSVLDALGREVAVLEENTLSAGDHAYLFEGADLPAGLYLARLEIYGRVETKRFTVVR